MPTTANTPNPQSRGFAVRIDDLLLRLAESPERPLSIQDAPMEADRVNTAINPEEIVESFGEVFARSEFWGGEGLRFAHLRDNLDNHASRFWDSEGIDVSRKQDRAGTGMILENALESMNEVHSSWPNHHLAYGHDVNRGGIYGGTLYLALQNKYRVAESPIADPFTGQFEDQDPYAGEATNGDINSTAFIAEETYAALGSNGIHRDTSDGEGTGWGHWNDLTVRTFIRGLKGRIVAADNWDIYEVTSGGAAPSPLKSLPVGLPWTDAIDAGEAILASAEDHKVYAFALNDSDVLVEEASTDLGDLIPQAMVFARGFVFYSTLHREGHVGVGQLWRAELSSELTLVNSQLLRSWRGPDSLGAHSRYPTELVSTGEAILAPVRDKENTSSSLWRYDLADGAMTHVYRDAGVQRIEGIATVEGHYFVLRHDDKNSENLLFREDMSESSGADLYQDEGYLIGPLGDLFTADDKSWVTAKLDVTDMGDGREVDLLLTNNPDALDDPNHADWDLIKTYTSQDDSEVAVQRFARYIAGMVKLRPSTDKSQTPRVRSFAFRSYPGPGDLLFEIPVNVSDQISTPGRRPRRVPGWGTKILNELLSRSGREATLELYRHGITITGLLERVSSPSPEVGEAGSPQTHAMLRFRGRKATLVTS